MAAGLRIAFLLAAEHLAAVRGANARLDLLRSGAARNGNLLRGREDLEDPLLTLLPNDTISEEYWARVNRAINQEALNTPPPATLNDPPTTPTPEPWKKIFTASKEVNVMDNDQASKVLSNWEAGTPEPFNPGQQAVESTERKMGVVPYDMQIGAHLLYELSQKTPMTPPPSQENVDEAFMAQCPMIMFRDSLHISPPRCDGRLGSWSERNTQRPVLRWRDNGNGGLYFGVDSVLSGPGSVKFAEYQERFTLNKYHFELRNCMNVMRYKVEEQIIKVNHMAPRATSTMLEHDVSKSQKAFFYKYVIKHTNGTTVAETNLYRMDQSEVNFTFVEEDISSGEVMAVAQRQGYWQRDEWKDCKHNKRAWTITFPIAHEKFDTVATVQDLRVAAAATITLMAFRDEEVGYDGFQHKGQAHLYLALLRSIFLIVLIVLVVVVCLTLITTQSLDVRMRRFCFRLEAVLLPKRPAKVRPPVLNPTY